MKKISRSTKARPKIIMNNFYFFALIMKKIYSVSQLNKAEFQYFHIELWKETQKLQTGMIQSVNSNIEEIIYFNIQRQLFSQQVNIILKIITEDHAEIKNCIFDEIINVTEFLQYYKNSEEKSCRLEIDTKRYNFPKCIQIKLFFGNSKEDLQETLESDVQNQELDQVKNLEDLTNSQLSMEGQKIISTTFNFFSRIRRLDTITEVESSLYNDIRGRQSFQNMDLLNNQITDPRQLITQSTNYKLCESPTYDENKYPLSLKKHSSVRAPQLKIGNLANKLDFECQKFQNNEKKDNQNWQFQLHEDSRSNTKQFPDIIINSVVQLKNTGVKAIGTPNISKNYEEKVKREQKTGNLPPLTINSRRKSLANIQDLKKLVIPQDQQTRFRIKITLLIFLIIGLALVASSPQLIYTSAVINQKNKNQQKSDLKRKNRKKLSISKDNQKRSSSKLSKETKLKI